jgi:hypothetical protein
MNSTACDICTTVVTIIRAEGNLANISIAVLSNVTKTLCYTLGTSIVYKECNFIVNNIKNIVNWVCAGIPTKEICKKLKLC